MGGAGCCDNLPFGAPCSACAFDRLHRGSFGLPPPALADMEQGPFPPGVDVNPPPLGWDPVPLKSPDQIASEAADFVYLLKRLRWRRSEPRDRTLPDPLQKELKRLRLLIAYPDLQKLVKLVQAVFVQAYERKVDVKAVCDDLVACRKDWDTWLDKLKPKPLFSVAGDAWRRIQKALSTSP